VITGQRETQSEGGRSKVETGISSFYAAFS
jgi:hypothetical protein